MNKRTLYYPTYSSYREQAESEDLAAIGEGVQLYRERLAGACDPRIKDVYADALRAYEDELLTREYESKQERLDDPWFETDVREYDPGDMIDLTA